MKISVILSTYEQPWALERVLAGYIEQTHPDFELLVADDGSGPATADVVGRARDQGLNIVHVRHDDIGFRKTEILNRAILLSIGDYLVFSDGDCIPRRDFVEVHARLAAPDRFVSGGYLKLPSSVSDRIGLDDVRTGRFADLEWLLDMGWTPGRRALRLTKSPTLAKVFDTITTTRTRFGGHNASTWRDAIFAVNGFECRMGYGGLDRALGMRLRNLGLKGTQARFRAICLHLHHSRPYKDPATVQRNRDIMKRISKDREVRAHIGLAEVARQVGESTM